MKSRDQGIDPREEGEGLSRQGLAELDHKLEAALAHLLEDQIEVCGRESTDLGSLLASLGALQRTKPLDCGNDLLEIDLHSHEVDALSTVLHGPLLALQRHLQQLEQRVHLL